MKPDMIGERHELAKDAMRRWDELRQARTPFEADWRDIAELIRPQRGGFGLDDPGSRDIEKPLSSAPILAHANFASGIYSGITNPATRWGGLTTPDEDLNRWPPFAEWLDRQTRKIHNSFSPSLSSFYQASFQAYADVSAFGNACAYDQMDTSNRRFIDVTLSLAEVVVDIDFHGRICEMVRKFRLVPRQAAREFGKDALPKAIVTALDKHSTERHVYYHHIKKNDDFSPGAIGSRGKRWMSVHACAADETLLRVRGFDEMPFYFPRWDVDAGFTYGTGPGLVALPSARLNQRFQDATIRAAQFAAEPVKLAPDRNAIPLDGEWRPNSVVYNAVSTGGQRLVHTADMNGNIGLTIEEKRANVEDMKEAFYYTVMSLTGRTGISDDENRVIEEAKLRNWAPHADRIMHEYAAPKFERRYQLLFRAGQIDPVPDGTPDDAKLQIRYTSAAAMALRASEANAVRQYIADLMPLMQIKPELIDRLSADDYAEVLHEASPTLPQRLLVSREEAAAKAEARAQAQQAAQMAEMAKTGGAGLRDMAEAGAIAQGQGEGSGQ